MISRKERTAAEVSAWLVEKGAAPEEVEAIVERLTSLQLLDDERFAVLYTEDKRNLAGWGSERIERTLIERGIPSEVARQAVSDGTDEDVERAISVLVERGSDLEDERDRQRALGLLARRGYSSVDSYEAIRRLRKGRTGGNGRGSDLPSDTSRSR